LKAVRCVRKSLSRLRGSNMPMRTKSEMYTNCGYIFESLDLNEAPLPFASAERFLPSLIIA
jgi:hypothetical protein